MWRSCHRCTALGFQSISFQLDSLYHGYVWPCRSVSAGLGLLKRTYSEGHNPNYTSWIVHALADPSLNVIPALAFLLHPHVWKRVSRIMHKSNNNNDQQLEENTFYIPPEDDDIEEGVKITDKYGSMQLQ